MEGEKPMRPEFGRRRISRRCGLALPMTLVILLFGSVLVATAFYIVQNMYSTSRRSVTHAELYNAAQTGVEMAKTVLWEKEIRIDELTYDPHPSTGEPIDTIRAIDGSSGDPLDKDLQEIDGSLVGSPGVKVSVAILDCNYRIPETITLTENDRKILPPRWVGGEGTVPDVEIGPPEGTSVIIDPSRYLNVGGGGSGQRRYVIRSTASHSVTGMDVTIEAMVVVRKP